MTGRKIFASLSGAAHIHNVVCLVPGDDRIRFMGVPAGAAGATIEGDWDPLGMRGTDSRTLVLDQAVVPANNEWLPPGAFDQAATRWPYFYMTLSFAYLGPHAGRSSTPPPPTCGATAAGARPGVTTPSSSRAGPR